MIYGIKVVKNMSLHTRVDAVLAHRSYFVEWEFLSGDFLLRCLANSSDSVSYDCGADQNSNDDTHATQICCFFHFLEGFLQPDTSGAYSLFPTPPEVLLSYLTRRVRALHENLLAFFREPSAN